jgi:hypothetical protein
MYLPSFFLKVTSLSVACGFEYGICKILFECCGGDHDISDHRGYDYYVLKHTITALYQQSSGSKLKEWAKGIEFGLARDFLHAVKSYNMGASSLTPPLKEGVL